MGPGGITETVWHFAGYLQIINDIARDRIDYDEGIFRRLQDDYITPRPDFDSNPALDELASRGVKLAESPPFEELQASHLIPKKWLADRFPATLEADLNDGDPRIIRPPGTAGSGASSGEFKISVHYEEGQQTLLDLRQYNFMRDSDVLLDPEGAHLTFDPAIIDEHAESALKGMVDDANNEIPQEWWIPQTTNGALEFVKAHNEDMSAQDGTPDAHSVVPGYYVNGVLQAPPETVEEVPAETAPDYGQGLGQWAELGGNESFNAALIVDLGEASRNMIVMGDYFLTNAIFQTNSLMDKAEVEGAGGGNSALSTGDNVLENIAHFNEHPGLHADLPKIFAGPNWNVDVVEGDFYSIHALVQLNYLSDNDIVLQTNSQSHGEYYTGGNTLGNLAEVFNGTIKYDLIIIGGSYHGMNVIFQNNILLNNDTIKMLADGLSPEQSAVAGQNELTNRATIETYGDDNFLPMEDNLLKVLEALANGVTSLDPSFGTFLSGTGGTFNVLYVTGEYYDINAVWQTNVTSDIDLLIQMMGKAQLPAVFADDTFVQSAVTGLNVLTNDAAIVDVGATNTFLNGELYVETILVQAELLPTNEDPQLGSDAQALVSELVAFVGEAQTETSKEPGAIPPPPHDDPVSTMMT